MVGLTAAVRPPAGEAPRPTTAPPSSSIPAAAEVGIIVGTTRILLATSSTRKLKLRMLRQVHPVTWQAISAWP